jgi:AcrR family transcriptional regulator
LSRRAVLDVAVRLADRDGLDALSMRSLGQELGVEAMALYNHVENKDDLLDGMVDLVAAEFEVPQPPAGDWKTAVRDSVVSVHQRLLQHPWACPLAVTRPHVGPAMLRYIDAMVGTLRAAGFSLQMTHHAIHAIDSHTFGFTLQELNFPETVEGFGPEMTAMFLGERAQEYPHLTELVADTTHDHLIEFEFLLDLILDGLERVGLDSRAGR